MLIEKILEQKGRDCATVRPGASISSVVAVLFERRVGAVVIEDLKSNVLGIFSERDLVKLLAHRGADGLIVKVRDVMTSPVLTCKPTDRIDSVMATMSQRRIRHMPVIENDALTGMISIRDLIRDRLDEKEREAAVLLDMSRTHL